MNVLRRQGRAGASGFWTSRLKVNTSIGHIVWASPGRAVWSMGNGVGGVLSDRQVGRVAEDPVPLLRPRHCCRRLAPPALPVEPKLASSYEGTKK